MNWRFNCNWTFGTPAGSVEKPALYHCKMLIKKTVPSQLYRSVTGLIPVVTHSYRAGGPVKEAPHVSGFKGGEVRLPSFPEMIRIHACD